MSDAYRQHRAALVGAIPPLAAMLPAEPPALPPGCALTAGEADRLLADAANHQGSLLIVLGWGDGSILRGIVADPVLRAKRVVIVFFKGEETALAASLVASDVHALLQAASIHFLSAAAAVEAEMMALALCGQHAGIPPLAGCDIIDGHPVAGEAAELRAAFSPIFRQALIDRPQAYGNDITDSFTGVFNAARNAAILLAAPALADLAGVVGDRPVISIAAGPSLKRRIDDLRRLRGKCILVACDAVLHGLLDAGVDPHFVTPLERVPLIVPMLTRANESAAIWAGLPVCPSEAVAPFAGRAIGVYCGDRLYDWLWPEVHGRVNSGLSTGVLSVNVAAALGTGPVYLVGHDLSKTAEASHWDGAGYAGDDWKRVKTIVEKGGTVLSGYEPRWIEGNDGGQVESIAWWDRFRGEIAYEARRLRGQGRRIINPNAHDRIFAHIADTEAAPLPDPASLDDMPPLKLPAGSPERLAAWKLRARKLPEDARHLGEHLEGLRGRIAEAVRTLPERWPVEELARELRVAEAVSEGNRTAFDYVLRSAVHNLNAEMHHRRRQATSLARSRYAMLESMDDLCHALGNALTRLAEPMEEIARVHAA